MCVSCILSTGKESKFQGIYFNDCFLSLSLILFFIMSFRFPQKAEYGLSRIFIITEHEALSQQAINPIITKFGGYWYFEWVATKLKALIVY